MYDNFMKAADMLIKNGYMSKNMVDELINVYTAPDRHYHNLEHIDFMLGASKEDVYEVETKLAIMYHDAVYDPMSKDNETKSAAMAADRILTHIPNSHNSRLRGLFDAEISGTIIYPVVDMIEHTGLHDRVSLFREERYNKELPHVDPLNRRCLSIMDIDLLGFALPYEKMKQNSENIRKEFHMIDDDTFNEGRLNFFEKLLDRPTIFRTEIYGADNEWKARKNIIREMMEITRGETGSFTA